MQNYVIILFSLFFFGNVNAQGTINGSFTHDGIVRTFSFYVPQSYSSNENVPLIIDLHGFSSDGETQALKSNFAAIADTANFIVAHPDGTFEPITNLRFWNYGNVMGSTVDDIGFIEALIDTISAQYNINQNRIYACGMSNGSFMSYYLACQSNRFAAVGGVTGTMGVDMHANCNPARPTPTIHVHGTADPINPYAGNSTSIGIEALTGYWVNQNSCNPTPQITPIPDIDPDDDATAERFLYTNGTDGNTVELFKVTDGGHTWPGYYIFTFNGNTCMDFSASKELWRFFSQYEITEPLAVQSLETLSDLRLYPNPANNILYVESSHEAIIKVSIVDLQGRMVAHFSDENIQFIDLGFLQSGNYVAEISSKEYSILRKIVKI